MTAEETLERSATAGEYVLGTLSGSERVAFEQGLVRDQGLMAEVYFWQDRLLPLAGRASPQQPRAALWPAIESRLVLPGASALPSAANDAVWRRLRRWQWMGGSAMAASVVLATVLGMKLLAPPEAPAARYLAVLQAPLDQSTGWIVEVTSGQRVRLVPVGPMAAVPEGKALQFWTKPDGAAGPTSLGLVRAGQTTELPASMLPAVGAKQLFELTLEPAAGSPIGRPTGPILFVGRSVQL